MKLILDQSFSKTKLHFEEFFDFNKDFDQEDFLKNTKEIEQIDYSNKNFDIESLLQNI